MASRIEIAQVVAMIGAAYPGFAATKETVEVYCELLKDLPADLLRVAALQCCAETGRKFAPSVGELRGAVSAIQRKGNGVPTALEAWNEVRNAPKSLQYREITDEVDENGRTIVRITPYQWSHPLVERVALMLGFPSFPSDENESVDRAHFFKQYEHELQRYSDDAIELPEVKAYIQTRRHSALPIEQVLKQLEG